MTSTNDGKDVNCKQSSGPKGKLYFIELYKYLDSRLSGEGALQERTQNLCQAWESIHSLCLQSSPKLHLHLLGWLQTHTARIILHTEWQKSETLPHHAKLVEAIDAHIKESKDAIAARKGSGLFWETHLLKRAEWFKKVLSNPWGHPILKRLSNPTEEKPTDKEVIEWLREERSEMFVSRLRQLAMSKACADIAASLTTAVMDRARASAAANEQDKDKIDKNEPTFADILSREAGFNSDVWDLLTDLEFVLLFKGDNPSRCIELAKQRSLRSGYKLVERLLGRVDKLPREKKLWKNAKKVAELIAQVTITRCMVLPSCAGVVYDALYRCARSLAALLPPAALPRAASALAAPAATAAHLHTLATAVAEKCKDEMKAFVCELYVRAITTGMNELERLKLKTEKASEARSTEQMLCTWFTQLGTLLCKSPRLNYECALTAFSVHPSPAMYERIVAAPPLPPLVTHTESHETSADTNTEFGSWATDSRTTTNFVKTSETLNIKQIQNNANVLSTAVLTEGEAIGLGADLCQDLAVLLSGPRHKILSWDINRDVLLENCRTYMERTDGGTRALTTELKYLNLDPRSFQHLPFEKDDEDNIYYGIEKGYEHLVEHDEVEVENQWHRVLFDSETEDAVSSCMYDTDSSPVRRKKKKSKRLDSTDEDVDPLSLSDDQLHQRKKERPHSKERLKKNKSSKNKESNEKLTSEKKEHKAERKERKKKDKITSSEPSVPLSKLVGMKVARVEQILEKQEKSNDEHNQNRELSITSLNSDSGDNNVVFDGLYSMDDISSPEKSNRSLQGLCNKTIKSNADLDDDNKPLSQVINQSQSQNKIKEMHPTASSQNKYTPHDKESTFNTECKDIPTQQDNAVKQSIKRLIEVRRIKSDTNIQPNMSQLQNFNKSSQRQSIVMPSTTPQDVIEPYSMPPNTSSPLQQNTPTNTVNINQFEHMSPSVSEVRNILNGNSATSNTSDNLYVGRIVFGLAKYTSSLNEQKLKENDTQNKSNSVSPALKTESRQVYKIYNKRPPDREKRIAQKQVLVRNQPQQQCDKPKYINETKTENNHFVNEHPQRPCDKLNIKNDTKTIYKNLVNELQPQKQFDKLNNTNETSTGFKNLFNELQHQLGEKVKNTNETKTIYKNLVNELQPHQSCDKFKTKIATKSNYKHFVDELKATINAGVIEDELYKEAMIQNDNVPSSKTFSIPNPNKSKTHSPLIPQSAKSFVNQKITEAPNTFARLNYMHKNKQSNVRPKPTSSVKQTQEKMSSELDKQIVHYKLDKFNYHQTKDLTISRMGTGIQNRQSKDTPLLIKKREGPAPLTIQKRDIDASAITQNRATCNSPNMTKDQFGISTVIKQNERKYPIKMKTDATEETAASKNTIKSQVHFGTSEPTKVSLLKEKDQHDILLLLRQQNKLNAQIQKIQPELKLTNIDQVSPQYKTESRSANYNIISNSRDFGGKDISQLNDYENKNKPNEKSESLTKTIILPNDQKYPSVIKMLKSGSKTFNSSQSMSKSEPSCAIERALNDVKSDSKMPVKRERHTQKKIHLDKETKSDWKLVMQDLLKHKTPSRGPNALDVALNKDSFKKHVANNENSNEKSVELKKNEKLAENTISYNSNIDYQKIIPSNSISRTAVPSNSVTSIHLDLPKRIIKPEVIQKTDINYLPKASLPDVPKNACDVLNNHDPFISGLPNSDYDILEELMDDDLRQEIGELISDDESLQYTSLTDKKGQCSNIVTPYDKKFYETTQRTVRTQEMQNICATSLQRHHTFVATNITGNVANSNLVQFPPSSASASSFNNIGQVYTNIEVSGTIKMTHPNNIVHNIEIPAIKVNNTTASHRSSVVQNQNSLHTSRPDNDVYLKRDNLDSRNVFFTSIPQRTSLQNVVISSGTVYEPYHPVQIQENHNSQMRNFNPNTYVTVNNMPNISFLPTTTFVSPSITPLVFGNTSLETGTQSNMQHTLPTSSIHPVKYSCEPNLNNANQSNSFVESVTTIDNNNKITRKSVHSLPDVKLQNQGYSILTHERKHLPPAQVENKLSCSKTEPKLSPKIKPLGDIDTKILITKQSKSLQQKRMALINREVRHYINHPPIPLPYIPLNKAETKNSNSNGNEKDGILNKEKSIDNVVPVVENISDLKNSKNESLKKCKNDEDITIVAESKERTNERKTKYSNNLRRDPLTSTALPGHVQKEEMILEKTSEMKIKKGELKVKNPPVKDTPTLKRKILKTNLVNTTHKTTKVRRSKAAINLNYPQDNSVKTTTVHQLEQNSGVHGHLEINGIVAKKTDTSNLNMFAIDNESFDVEEQLIGSVISKSTFNEPIKDFHISASTEVKISGKSYEKENDLNKSQKVVNEKVESNGVKTHTEVDETSNKNNFREQVSNVDNDDSGKVYTGKSVQRRSPKKRIVLIKRNNETKTLKKVRRNEGPKNKLNINHKPLIISDGKSEDGKIKVLPTHNSSPIKETELTICNEVIDLDEVSERSVPENESTNNLIPVYNNDQVANLKNQICRITNKSFSRKQQNYIYSDIKDLNQVIFQEISSKKSKSKGHKAFRVVLPNGTKFKAVISGKKNNDVNNLIIDTQVKCLLLNNFFNNKKSSSDKVSLNKTVGNFTNTNKALENTNAMETIDLVSDDESDSGFAVTTDSGHFVIRSLGKEDFAKHQKRLSSKCFVPLSRRSAEELIALNTKINKTESCGTEKNVITREEEFHNNQNGPSEDVTTISILSSDKKVQEVTYLEAACFNDNAINEALVDLVSEKNNMESTPNERQNISNTLIINEEVSNVQLISKSIEEKKRDFHVTFNRAQRTTNNFNCFIKLSRCDNLVKKIDALKHKCFVELVRCDNVSFNNENLCQILPLVEEEKSIVEETLPYNEKDSDPRNSRQSYAGDYKLNVDSINPLLEEGEEKFESKLERSTSCSILTDFLKCREIMDDQDIISVNDQHIKLPIYLEVTCCAEWSITKRGVFLQTAMSMERIQKNLILFNNSSLDYPQVSTDFKRNTETEKTICALNTSPSYQVQSLGRLVLKLIESKSYLVLLTSIPHENAKRTENRNSLLKRKSNVEYKSSSKKICKLQHQISSHQNRAITEQVHNKPGAGTNEDLVQKCLLNSKTANVCDQTDLPNNLSLNENKICINTDNKVASLTVENILTTKLSEPNCFQSNESSNKISKVEHQIASCEENAMTETVENRPCSVIDENVSLKNLLEPDNVNIFDQTKIAANKCVTNIIVNENIDSVSTDKERVCFKNVITADPNGDRLTFNKDTGLTIDVQVVIEPYEDNKHTDDLTGETNRLNKTGHKECNADPIKLETTALINESYIGKENSTTSNTTTVINNTYILEGKDTSIKHDKAVNKQNKLDFINTDHSYATIDQDDSDGLKHTSRIKSSCNKDDNSDLTNKEANAMNDTILELQNETETIQDVVLGNIETGDVINEQVAEDTYDVLRNVTLVYQDNTEIMLKGIEYEDPIAGTCYMFPLENSTMFSDIVDNGDYFGDEKQDENYRDDNKMQTISGTGVDVLCDECLSVIPPIKTYSMCEKENKGHCSDKLSKRGVKRKNSLDYKLCEKRYRKSKNIDYLKASVDTQMNTAYGKEFKRLLNYYSSIKFSYTRPFDKEQIDVSDLLSAWPIKETRKAPLSASESSDIFKDNTEQECYPDPLKQTLVEELSSAYIEYPITADDTSETNFSMGFGEESGRVIQNLEKKDNILKFSAATLSDVKQSQPFLMSKGYVDCEKSIEVSNLFSSSRKDQNIKIKPCTDYIHLKDKVRSYFKKTAIELKYNWIRDNLKDKDLMWNFNGECNITNCLLDFYLHDFIEPPPVESIVQVVQIGQLPVSAAAQNPVSCDPRVTQVANASPPQCSEENSAHDDSQSPMKTEYTELRTADLTLPLVAEYNHHDCHKVTESQEPAHLHNSQELLQSEFGYCDKVDSKDEYNHEEVKDLSLRNKELQMLGKEDTNHTVYHYDPNVENECPELDTQANYFDSTNKENNVSERTDQIAHAMSAAGITSTVENSTKTHAFGNILAEKMHQSNNDQTQNHINNCSNAATINAAALQQALAQILPPPLNQTTSTETDLPTPSLTPQVLHIVQGKNAEGNQVTLVDNVQQSVINAPNAAPVLHIVQNKSPNTNASCNGTPVQQTNAFGALSLVETGLQQSGNQLLHIVNTGNQKDNNANQLLKRVNLLTNLANVQGSSEQKMLQFVCKSSDGKAIQLNTPHQGSMVLRLQPIETQNIQDGTNTDQLSPTLSATSSAPIQETINTQQEIKSRSVYEENYAKFIQNTTSKSSTEKATSLPKFNQAFGKPVFQEENQKDSEINSNDTHLSSVNSSDDTSETPDNGLNLDHIGQISSPPLLLRKSPQTSQAQPSLVQQIKQSITPMNTPMNIQTMHGGVIYTRQIPVNIGGGQTINLITVPSTELIDDPNHKQSDVKFVNQGDIVEPSIIKIVPQTTANSDLSPDDSNHKAGTLNDSGQNTPTQPVLTQMRIKLPMLSKAPQMVSGARVVRPSFFQIQRNVIGGANQPVYQQLVLTTAPPLGQQPIRLPQSQMTRQIKVPSESSPESQLSSSTLEQLREFDMVLEQVKERSTVQPNSTTNSSMSKPHTTTSNETSENVSTAPTPTEPTPVLYSVGANQQFNVAYVNRKSTITTPTTSTFVRSPDSSITETPTSSNHSVQVSQTVTSATTSNSTTGQQSNPKPGKISSRSRPRPKASSNPPNTLKLNNVPPKPSTQKPLEDEQTTQRILYILAEYREQVENCPDKNKPAPRRRTNPPSNPGSSKRKKSSSGSRRSAGRDSSPIHGDDANRTMGSEDSSCGTSQGDCNENCLESPSPQDSPRKLPRKLSFESETPPPQPRPPLQRNVIVADGQTITVARGPTGKPATALLMPANYILPVSMLKGGQQIAIVTNRGPKLLTVSGGEGGTTGALLLQRLIGPAGLKPMLARPGVRHVRLPTAALHNLHAFNFASATTVQPPDSTMSPAPASTPPDLVETRAAASPWTEKENQDVKPERSPSPDGSEPWNVPTSANTHEYTYEETVRTDNLDRTVLDPIPDRYSPDMEAQRIFDKMFDVDAKRSYVVDTQDDSPRCGYDIDTSDCDDKCYHQVVQKRDISTHRQHRLTHVTAAALRHKYAILEHELRLQKSLSEECEDLGVDSPSASELFPEAELLFAGSPAQDHTQDQHPHRPHTPPPIIINQSVPRPDMDDQIATDHLLQRPDLQEETNSDLAMNLGLDDVGIVTVTENGATITLDHEEFARSHPNTTFHKEPTEETEMHPYTISGIKSRHITSTIFHASRAPATVLMGPQTTVISQASHDSPHIQHNIRYTHMDNIINAPVAQQHNLNLSTVLVKDDGLTRYDSILTDSRELHLSNTASAIVHSVGNATQVIRRVGYEDDKRDPRYLIDDPDTLMGGDDTKMMGEDSSREALESMSGDVDYDRSSPERQTELYWESNSVADRSDRRPMDFSSDSEKCCKSPPYEENNSTDSSGMSTQVRLDSVIKDARGIDRSGSADGSSADDTHPPLRTYPAKRVYHHPLDRDSGRSLSGKTRAGEGLDSLDSRRRASGRGVVKRCCHCCSGSPQPPRPKKPKPRKPTLDYNMH